MTERAQVLFFLQAEAGIRDVAVTGVQTCALPILVDDQAEGRRTGDVVPVEDEPIAKDAAISAHGPPTPQYRGHRSRAHRSWEKHFRYRKIGRASCRERV